MTIDWHSKTTRGLAGTIITLLLGTILQAYLDRQTQARIGNYLWENSLGIVAIIGILVLLVLIFRQDRKLREFKNKIAAEEPPTFKRFEDLKNIKFGYVEYRPLLYYDVGGNPRGVGITLLRLLFETENIKLIDINRNLRWHDFIQNLAAKKYDIVATPIFETRERSKLISFCSPIFYSDIGMYVKKDSKLLGHLGPHSKPFKEAIQLAQQARPKLVAIEGEVSGKMAKKYLIPKGSEVSEWLMPETGSVNSLIAALNDGTPECELVFAETFQAEHTPPVQNGDVFNILLPKQLTYPVSFAVRRSDYVLKNFVNLKLFDIEKTVEGGVLAIILKELQQHPDYKDYTLERIKQFFIRGLHPEPGTSTGGTDPTNAQGPLEDTAADPQSGSVTSIMERKRKTNGH